MSKGSEYPCRSLELFLSIRSSFAMNFKLIAQLFHHNSCCMGFCSKISYFLTKLIDLIVVSAWTSPSIERLMAVWKGSAFGMRGSGAATITILIHPDSSVWPGPFFCDLRRHGSLSVIGRVHHMELYRDRTKKNLDTRMMHHLVGLPAW